MTLSASTVSKRSRHAADRRGKTARNHTVPSNFLRSAGSTLILTLAPFRATSSAEASDRLIASARSQKLPNDAAFAGRHSSGGAEGCTGGTVGAGIGSTFFSASTIGGCGTRSTDGTFDSRDQLISSGGWF